MTARFIRNATIVLLAFAAPLVSGPARGDGSAGGNGSSQPQPVCSFFDTTDYASDHIAWELGQCWESWRRPASACTRTSVHTFTLDDPSSTIVFTASDDDAATTGLATTAAQCAARHLTLQVQRELGRGGWTTIGSYSEWGEWSSSDNTCYLWLGWKSLAIPSTTSRVRLTAQTIRHDGTYAGTITTASYIIPGGVEPCVDVTP